MVATEIDIPTIPEFGSDEEKLAWLTARHDEMAMEIAELRFKNRLWQNQLFGSRSEKVKAHDADIGQTRLFDEEVVGDDTENHTGEKDTGEKDTGGENTQANTSPQAEEKESQRGRGQAKERSHGRKEIPDDLEKMVRTHGDTGPRHDANGTELVITGWNEHKRLHKIPEQIVCLVDRYAIWGLPDTRETVETTPPLPCIIKRGKLSDDFLCDIAIRKYLLSLPLHRQLRDLNTLGADLAVSTMCDGMRALADFVRPVYKSICAQVLSQNVMHVDETTMKQQDDTHGKVTRYLWAWHANKQVAFHFGTRAGEEVREFLRNHAPPPPDPDHKRYSLTDGYAAYDKPFAEHNIIHAGCWAHIRRDWKALNDAKINVAKEIFAAITQLYRCEKDAKKEIAKKKLQADQADACRLRHRQEKAQPTLDRIADLIERHQPLYDPKRTIGEAFTTIANQFHKLRVYAETGCVPIDNNVVERDMRQVAVGRKNYLFVGSEDAGDWCAIMYSLIESARLCNRDVRAYLHRVVAGLHAGENPATLTPAALMRELPRAKK